MGKAQSADEKNVLGVDIVFEAGFLSFTSEEVARRVGTLAESSTFFPFKKEGVFAKSVSVPVGGAIKIKLSLRNHRERVVLEAREDLLTAKWYHDVGWWWNRLQKALKPIPLVGDTLEKAAPDMIQKIRLDYSVAVSKEKSLNYKLILRDTDLIDCPNILMSWEGDFLL